jgi:hypothetical protein
MRETHLFSCILAIGISINVEARDFPIPDASITISLPEPWRPIDSAIVKASNDDMLSTRPETTTRYITGFTRGEVPAGHDIGTEYIWIQRTPAAMTPEQLLSLIPKTIEKHKKTLDDLLKKDIQASDFDAPYFDQKAGLVVMPSSSTRANGQKLLGVAYLLPLRSELVSIVVQSSPDRANAVFTEAHIAVSSLKISEDAKPTRSWREKLLQLLGK